MVRSSNTETESGIREAAGPQHVAEVVVYAWGDRYFDKSWGRLPWSPVPGLEVHAALTRA